ncbi:trypsin epsilon-like [Leptidea sinapis]|uniref:trypsin epsilon-like n=1 Tax=Leptidea sinapis TaxID=189913 RepID=UPI0021C2A106|nr:trypsin epsilon-like [Leptidea sinapis]
MLNRKIFKGTRVTIREHPYLASIRRNYVHFLTATLLTSNTAVTVAHPLHRSAVKPISLARIDVLLEKQTKVFVTGWGRCDFTGKELCLPRSSIYFPDEPVDPMLRTISFIHSKPTKYCDSYRLRENTIDDKMMCAGVGRETDVMAPCLAVPGAPLVADGQIIAVLSWGFGCGYLHDLPLVYTNLVKHSSWLSHNIKMMNNLTMLHLGNLFVATRAYRLSKWLEKTRVIKPLVRLEVGKELKASEMDEQLAKLLGKVYDVRDFLFGGIYHVKKKTLLKELQKKDGGQENLPLNGEEGASSGFGIPDDILAKVDEILESGIVIEATNRSESDGLHDQY